MGIDLFEDSSAKKKKKERKKEKKEAVVKDVNGENRVTKNIKNSDYLISWFRELSSHLQK